MRLEKNVEWRFMEGPELAYSPDKYPNTGVVSNLGSTSEIYDGIASVRGMVATQNLGGSDSTPSQLLQTNTLVDTYVSNTSVTPPIANQQFQVTPVPYFNKGFSDRITIIRDSMSTYDYTTTTGLPLGWDSTNHQIFFTAVIPMKFIHDFWMQLNFPIFNVGFQLNLYFNQPNGQSPYQTQFPPCMTGDNSSLVPASGGSPTLGGVPSNVVGAPTIFYNGTVGANSGCRLWYKSVKYAPEDAARISDMFAKGYTRSVKFISTDYIPYAGLSPLQPGQTLNQTLTTSVVQPLRIWTLLYPVFANGSSTTGIVGTNAAGNTQPANSLQRSDYSWGTVPGFLQDVQIQVNNLPYYRNVINQGGAYPQDWYERIKEQIPAGWGSDFSYLDYIHTWAAMCNDVSRLSDRLQSPTQSVSLQLTGTRADKGPFGVVPTFLVERQNQCTFRFSSSDVQLVVGNIEGS